MIKDSESFLLKPKQEVDNKVGVLLFHGWTSSPYELRNLGKFLADKGLTVYAPLLSGHGTCPEDMLAVGWENWANDADNAYIEFKSHCDKMFVGGISMGGNLSIYLAEKYPEIKGLISMGTPIFLRKFYLRLLLPFIERVHPVTNKSYSSYARREVIDHKRHYWSLPTKSVGDAIDGMFDSRRKLKKIKCPALVMQSERDQLLNNSNARYLFKNLGTLEDKKQLVWIKDSDHTFIVDIYQEQIFEKVLQFINQNLTPNPLS